MKAKIQKIAARIAGGIVISALYPLPGLTLTAASHRSNGSATPIDMTIAVIGLVINVALATQLGKTHRHRLPWSALIVLLAPHALFGWLLGIYNLPWFIWVLAGSGVAIVAVVLSYELGVAGTRALLVALLVAGVGTIVGATLSRIAEALALALALAVAWFWAVGGARFRLEAEGFDPYQTFWILTIVSWEGLWFGWLADTFLIPSFGNWLVNVLIS